MITTDHVLLPGPAFTRPSTMVKIIGLAKRKEGMPLAEFRRYSLETHAAKDLKPPKVCAVTTYATSADGGYALGEAFLAAASYPVVR